LNQVVVDVIAIKIAMNV